MASYKYRARKQITDKIIEAVIYAATREKALNYIEKMGYILESIEEINTPDRRVYARVVLELPIHYSRFKPNSLVHFNQEGITKNISAGGVLFKTKKSFSVGTILEIVLELPQDLEDIQCLARVVRVETIEEGSEYNLAICFLELPNSERKRLNQYIQKITK